MFCAFLLSAFLDFICSGFVAFLGDFLDVFGDVAAAAASPSGVDFSVDFSVAHGTASLHPVHTPLTSWPS